MLMIVGTASVRISVETGVSVIFLYFVSSETIDQYGVANS